MYMCAYVASKVGNRAELPFAFSIVKFFPRTTLYSTVMLHVQYIVATPVTECAAYVNSFSPFVLVQRLYETPS